VQLDIAETLLALQRKEENRTNRWPHSAMASGCPSPSRSRHNSLSPCCSTSSTRPRMTPTVRPSPRWPQTISPNCAPRVTSRQA
jgi:hypothetical protein